MTIEFFSFLTPLLAILLGLFLLLKAQKAIDLQIAFYRFINWKMEPISFSKEIRNTRLMGAFLLLCVLAVAAWSIFR